MREWWEGRCPPSRPATYPGTGRRARNPNGTFGAQDQVRSVAVRRDPELSCGRKPPLQRVERSHSASLQVHRLRTTQPKNRPFTRRSDRQITLRSPSLTATVRPRQSIRRLFPGRDGDLFFPRRSGRGIFFEETIWHWQAGDLGGTRRPAHGGLRGGQKGSARSTSEGQFVVLGALRPLL